MALVASSRRGETTAVDMNNLQAASKLVDNSLTRDERLPELWDLLQGTGGDYSDRLADFQQTRLIPLPSAILQQYEYMEYKCYMGLMPEINRAWVTMDNRIFLWNYFGGADADFVSYDGLDQIIITAGLVRPRPGVFLDEIQYLLVLATPVEIVILGLTFAGGSVFGEMTLCPTPLSVPSDNVNILRIAGTANGRVFMCGRDGNLYELKYQAEDGWFTRKCRKLNHSQSPFTPYVPSFLRLWSETPIVDIAIDDSRNILYTLASGGAFLQVWDLGANGENMRLVKTHKSVKTEAHAHYARYDTGDEIKSIHVIPATESPDVHLVAVTQTGVRLYMTTSTIGTNRRPVRGGRPQNLTVIAVRAPPRVPGADTRMQQYNSVHTTLYEHGVFLMADQKKDEEQDTVIGVHPELFETRRDLYNYQPALMECAAVMNIDGKTWSMREVPLSITLNMDRISPLAPNYAYVAPVRRPDDVAGAGRQDSLLSLLFGGARQQMQRVEPIRSRPNELATQHVLPQRQFLCLTNMGLQVVVKKRPVDRLYDLLMEAGSADTDRLNQFFTQYGEAQACAMCLVLACSNPHRAGGMAGLQSLEAGHYLGGAPTMGMAVSAARHTVGTIPAVDHNTAKFAADAFFRHGGVASLPDLPSSMGGAVEVGQAVTAPRINYSGKHDGLYLYLARLLRPVWDQLITILPDDKRSKQVVRFSREQLGELAQTLQNLYAFLSSPLVRNFTALSQGDYYGHPSMRQRLLDIQHRKRQEEAHKMEQRSLHNVLGLVSRCIEGIRFLLILQSAGLQKLTAVVHPDLAQRLANTTFRDLVSTKDGEQTAGSLVTELANLTIRESGSVDALNDELSRDCPTFVSGKDSHRYKGFELLYRAEAAPGAREREELLQESLRAFVKAAGTIDNLKSITDKYKFLRFYPGVLDIGLARAHVVDSEERALAYYKAGQPREDSQGQMAFDARMPCYSVILGALAELMSPPSAVRPAVAAEEARRPVMDSNDLERARNIFLQRAISSQDELFHMALYRWFIDSGHGSELLDLETPYLERFLQRDDVDVNMLANYYVRTQRFAQAAVIRAKQAERQDVPYSLQERIDFLGTAITNAKSGSISAPIDGDFLHDLEEKKEVALIQLRVLKELQKLRADLVDASRRERAQQELDSKLMNISDIYNKYAEPFCLWDSCLSIVHCSGYDDSALVARIWREIIERELGDTDVHSGFSHLRAHVISIGREYYPSEIVFNLRFLCNALEERAYLMRYPEKDWVVEIMRQVGVPDAELFNVYNGIYESRDPLWTQEAAQTHLIAVLLQILKRVCSADDRSGLARSSRSQMQALQAVQAHDQISKYLVTLQSYASKEASDIAAELKVLQTKIRRG